MAGRRSVLFPSQGGIKVIITLYATITFLTLVKGVNPKTCKLMHLFEQNVSFDYV